VKAARWHGTRDVRIDEVPEPALRSAGDVIVSVDLAMICASDLAEWRDGPHVIPTQRPHKLTGRTAPVTLGHEYVGHVLEVGSEVTRVKPGDRVCGDACIKCGRCYWCLRGEYNICEFGGAVGFHSDGAFAPLVSVPDYTLYHVPESMPDAHAAVVEPIAVALHALRRVRLQAGDSVVVVGLGMVGTSTVLMAQALGTMKIIAVETSAVRAAFARDLGIAAVLDPREGNVQRTVRDLTGGIGSDIVLDCTGRPDVLISAVDLARRGGRIGVCGIPHDASSLRSDRLVYFEREILGCLGYCYDHDAVISLLGSSSTNLDALFASPVGLTRIVSDGLERMLSDPDAPLRIPVKPSAK